MSKNEKRPSFLGGAAVLAAAVAIVKIIGAVYKIPFLSLIHIWIAPPSPLRAASTARSAGGSLFCWA